MNNYGDFRNLIQWPLNGALYFKFLIILLAFWSSIFNCGCAQKSSLKINASTVGDLRKIDRLRFQHYLENPNLQMAGRFSTFFEQMSEVNGGSPELQAQYLIMSCQMRKAYYAANSISSEIRRKLFLAVIYTLSSIEHPSLRPPLATGVGRDPQKDKGVGRELRGVAKSEIWKDEWTAMRFTSRCERQAITEDLIIRKKLLALAKRYFEMQPVSVFLEDFTLLSLALDAGVKFPHHTKGYVILEKYKGTAYAKNPYFLRIQKQVAENMQIPVETLAASISESLHFTFSSLRLKKENIVAHGIDFPLLTRGSGYSENNVNSDVNNSFDAVVTDDSAMKHEESSAPMRNLRRM